MNMFKRFFTALTVVSTLLSTTLSCQKDTSGPEPTIEIDLPENTGMSYGQTANIPIPSSLSTRKDITLSLGFEQTDNVEISGGVKLRDQLSKAVTVDEKEQTIVINSSTLYPNGARSTTNDNKIPDSYTVTLFAKTGTGETVGKNDFNFTVSEGTIGISGADVSNEIPFAYALYSDNITTYKLETLDVPTQGTTWHLSHSTGESNSVAIENSTIQFSADAGDPDKKSEYTYDLRPVLLKDGFPVASTSFRVVFIPQVKFFFGMYYPDMDLTINLNLLHIALGNGYLSAEPMIYPENYKSSFSLQSVSLDDATFDNSAAIFSVNPQTGAITVKKDDTLKAGSYKIIVKAVTTTGHEFQTDLTLVMSPL
ncbi:MAG: hypothetical protein ACTIJ8_14630 [Sphingobacterium sp.]